MPSGSKRSRRNRNRNRSRNGCQGGGAPVCGDAALQRALRLSERSFRAEERKRRAEEDKARFLEAVTCAERDGTAWSRPFVEYWTAAPSSGAGLENLGNSCFMNSTLQCLAYCPRLAERLCEGSHARCCAKGGGGEGSFCALCEAETLAPALLLGARREEEAISPERLFRALPQVSPELEPGRQEDAHEFLQGMLDKMGEESPDVQQLFEGRLETVVQCLSCGAQRASEQPFTTLSLDIAKGDSLKQCLRALCAEELLRGEERYVCESQWCQGQRREARKQERVAQAPPLLALHLKRFGLDPHNGWKPTKIGKMVRFDETLQVPVSGDGGGDGREERYELCGLVVHQGPQLDCGHYVAFVKAPDGRWLRASDSLVRAASAREALSQQAYMLFFRRVAAHKEQLAARERDPQSGDEEDDKDEDEEKHEAIALPLSASPSLSVSLSVSPPGPRLASSSCDWTDDQCDAKEESDAESGDEGGAGGHASLPYCMEYPSSDEEGEWWTGRHSTR